ncbi:putative RNA recognition motif domain, nucleotide-binding alpha-beta plait domain superfamily [Arabidopsis thaliana]
MASKREPEDDLETKPILKKHKENSEEENKIKGTVELLETKSDQAPVKETVEGLDETPDSVEVPKKYMSGLLIRCFPSRKKTLYQGFHDSSIFYSIDFFKDVGQVVSVQLTTKRNGLRLSTGFVEFASANEAKKVRLVYSLMMKCILLVI